MAEIQEQDYLPPPFPDHTQLPESDGSFVKNFQEHPQSLLLTDSIGPVLERLHMVKFVVPMCCGENILHQRSP